MPSLADFTGCLWIVRRQIDDRRGGVPGEFRGSAVLRPQGDGLIYHETGRLRIGEGPVMEAHRRYVWTADGEGIAVRFEDGRPFHRFRPEGRASGTDHPCGQDLYRVEYDFLSWPAWTATWTVSGPAKDYVLTSRYERRAPGTTAPKGAPAFYVVTRLDPGT